MTKPRRSFLLAPLTAALLLAGCTSATPPPPPTPAAPAAAGVVSTHGRLQVAGNRIVGAHGRPVSLAGVSFGWSQWEAARFYNAGTVNWLKQDWNASIVRAALGLHQEPGSYLQAPAANRARVIAVADAAIAADLYVLIDWHDHHAHERTDLAVAFFTDMARRYGHQPHVIYEIYNEPLNTASWSRDVKPYAEKVIAAIRTIDPDNLIVVGTPAWAQDVDVAAADPIKDPNVAYTLHFYAGTHKAGLRAKARKALDLGAALFVTEWGTCNADGAGPVDEASVREWFDFMRENQLSHCNWGIYDKRETAAIIHPGATAQGGWKDADLTPSGRYARDLIRAWGK
ncbi:Endoglucanase Z precursor [Lacunisphaera limnophila]|uniref:Endoglucanase Z n=1 Tax=Lacunisphaera limnophila TaxID=1838286 RepID=A0A1I7PHY4_9BACT|nr:glycoside hydrolase family 5 protein [Lacunisphaera limnophila]AOS43233.1 Endoglucanase Z precursor [Lacunisphaera limnophila]